MAIDVEVVGDPAAVLARAGDFLASDPVRHNVILTLLHGRVADPLDGRYVIASCQGGVVGVVFQSPLTFVATITPMAQEVSAACVGLLGGESPPLPGVSGEAGSAARFAGQWSERTKSAAVPDQGQRIYEAEQVTQPPVPGALRCAEDADRPLLMEWLTGFHDEAGETRGDAAATVERRVSARQFWVWEDGTPTSMAAVTAPVAGVSRIQAVYTPPALRNRGYASACVAGLTADVLSTGVRCILYTDLGNPVSNSVYRRLGYSAVAEVLRYKFR